MKLWTCSSFETPSRKKLSVMLFSLMVLICPSLEAEPSLSLKGPRDVVWSDFLGVNAQLLWFEEAAYRNQIANGISERRGAAREPYCLRGLRPARSADRAP